jgi:hypothetical protein
MNLKTVYLAAGLLLGAAIHGQPALAQDATAPWSLGCPADGVTSVAQPIGRSGRSLTRVYRGSVEGEPTLCIVEENGQTRTMVRQLMPVGTHAAAVLRRELDRLFPARPGQVVSATNFVQVEGVLPPIQAVYENSFRYLGQRMLETPSGRCPVAVVVHREVGQTSNYVGQSTYYFNVANNELVRFEYAAEHGRPRNIGSWQVTGVCNAKQ